MINKLYLKNSNIPQRYLDLSKDFKTPSVDKIPYRQLGDIMNHAREFVTQGNNLLICSNFVGNGKTTWATKILLAYIESVSNYSHISNSPGLFINVTNFLNEKRMSMNYPELKEKINRIENSILTADLVVFDDIADKSISNFEYNNLYYWIDYRVSNMKSCIFTSNRLQDNLPDYLPEKLCSRIISYSIIEEFISEYDFRRGVDNVSTTSSN